MNEDGKFFGMTRKINQNWKKEKERGREKKKNTGKKEKSRRLQAQEIEYCSNLGPHEIHPKLAITNMA